MCYNKLTDIVSILICADAVIINGLTATDAACVVRQSVRLSVSLNMRAVAIYRKLPPACTAEAPRQVLRRVVLKEATNSQRTVCQSV